MRKIDMLRAGFVALCALFLGACATSAPKLGGDPGLRIVQASELPPPDRSDLTAEVQPYLVGPFDRLTIDVFGIEGLAAREIQVDASGRISFPLAGVIEVTGQTPGEIESLITQRLRAAYVRDPQVTVNLKETVSQVVTVEGQVKKPGLYPVLGKMTLLRAIAKAEGTDEFSRLNDVVVFRTSQGLRLAALYDISAIRRGVYADPQIYANDVIVVGESRARRLFKDVLAALPALVTPLIIAADRLSN